ncbi:integrase [Photobacterium jeanii]|uniref:Integrase n=1 Tax=Photobacterium jeanii TaxID=858640 RepID=A0A178K2R5_9GAMM|nr:tyrosine-type recombinase/integrase [Photobacterium jeanii]OAN11571.1 integrase [Photobacterium jeanii]PST91094.1 integrase [Photobacterium jeanii]
MNKQNWVKIFNSKQTTADDWQTITLKSYAHRTLVAFATDWNAFNEYCLSINTTALPASVDTVVRFLDEKAKTRKLASLKRYVITIRLAHRSLTMTDPCSHTQVRVLMQQFHDQKKDDNKQAAPLHAFHIDQLYSRFQTATSPKDVRDLAIWCLAFDALLKRGELSAITLENIIIESNGLITLTLESKSIRLSPATSAAINRWLTLSMIDEGYLFRRIDRHGNIGDNPLDHSSIYRVFRRASDELGVPANKIFSGQSPRVGAAQDLAFEGASLNEIQAQGRWKSPAMPAQYIGQKTKRDEEMDKFKTETPWDQ